MTNLAILSRDAGAYKDLISQAGIGDLVIEYCTSSGQNITNMENIEILLGDPSLCAEWVSKCPHLSWYQSTWAGVKPLMDQPARHFKLTGVKDVFGPQMCEYVFAYLLYFCRRIDDYQQLQQQQLWQPLSCPSLQGKTIGIMGLGSIGLEVAKMAKQFHMVVKGLCRTPRQLSNVDHVYTQDQLEPFAAELDFLVALLPHTTKTQGVINQSFLQKLPSHCVFINAGRGQTVDEGALLESLNKGQLKAAVLDVFEQEPLAKSHPYWRTANLHVTQHTSAVSKPVDIAGVFIDNFLRFQNNAPLKYLIDWQSEY